MLTIVDGINAGKTKIGVWHYCTANNLRFGQQDTCADCSGFHSWCLWHAGMPRYAFPENSADMARYFEANPSRRMSIEQAKHTFGATLIKGGINGYGPSGHVVFSLGNGTQTLESSGSGRGVGIQSINRLQWSHAGLAPVSFAAPAPPKPPAPPTPIPEGNMQSIVYNPGNGDRVDTFWVDQSGWLQHAWGANTGENMEKYTTEKIHFDQRPGGVSVTANGQWLHVRAVAVPTAGGAVRCICYDYHPAKGWSAYAAVPK